MLRVKFRFKDFGVEDQLFLIDLQLQPRPVLQPRLFLRLPVDGALLPPGSPSPVDCGREVAPENVRLRISRSGGPARKTVATLGWTTPKIGRFLGALVASPSRGPTGRLGGSAQPDVFQAGLPDHPSHQPGKDRAGLDRRTPFCFLARLSSEITREWRKTMGTNASQSIPQRYEFGGEKSN